MHGHDETVKQDVARTLENIGLTPIIFAEQPDKGRTVIEKFESEGNDVGLGRENGGSLGGAEGKQRETVE